TDRGKRRCGLDRPTRPTADDAERALSEIGVAPHREDWVVVRPPEPRDDLIGRLLVGFALEPEEQPRLIDALGGGLREVEGGWIAAPQRRRVVTLWWET